MWSISFIIKNGNQNILIAAIYLSATHDKNEIINCFEQWCETLSEYQSIIIFGDFNINMLNESICTKKFKQVYQTNGFKQIIKKPTRITMDTATMIDLCLCSNVKCIANVIDDDQISDQKTSK